MRISALAGPFVELSCALWICLVAGISYVGSTGLIEEGGRAFRIPRSAFASQQKKIRNSMTRVRITRRAGLFVEFSCAFKISREVATVGYAGSTGLIEESVRAFLVHRSAVTCS